MGCTCQHSTASATNLQSSYLVRTGAATEPLSEAFPVPAYPPAEWFTEAPDWLTPDTKISVDDEGRVAGVFYHAGQCLVHSPSDCPQPSPTGYAAFMQQEVITASGDPIDVGVIGNTHGHADPYGTVSSAQAHYADPSAQLISCRAYDMPYGGIILGAMVPGATYGDVALVRRSSLSGDWRVMPAEWWQAHGIQASAVAECEGFDCIGPTLVTRPGLPLVRTYAAPGRAAAMLGGVGGIQFDEEAVPMGTTRTTIPGGIVIEQTNTTDPATVGEPGPQARTAAPPQTPPAPPGASPDAGPPEGEETALVDRVTALEEQVASMGDALGQCVDFINSQMAAAVEAAVASAVELPEIATQ